MDIRITKQERADRVEAWPPGRLPVAFDLPKKGPVPHDVVHLLVESELGIADGFWGLLARGADPVALAGMAKAAGHASARRASVPDPSIVPIVQAERIVEAFEADLWTGGGDNDSLRAMAAAGCEQSLVPMPELGDSAVDGIRGRIADFHARWAALAIGGAVESRWPEGQAA